MHDIGDQLSGRMRRRARPGLVLAHRSGELHVELIAVEEAVELVEGEGGRPLGGDEEEVALSEPGLDRGADSGREPGTGRELRHGASERCPDRPGAARRSGGGGGPAARFDPIPSYAAKRHGTGAGGGQFRCGRGDPGGLRSSAAGSATRGGRRDVRRRRSGRTRREPCRPSSAR